VALPSRFFLNSNAVAPAEHRHFRPGGITLIADSMSFIASTIISASTVSLQPMTPGWQIDLGSAVDTTLGTLGLSNAELNSIAAAAITIGSTNTASINVSAGITLRWAPRQTLLLGRSR